MNDFGKQSDLLTILEKNVFRLPSSKVVDKRRVHLGGQGPAFRMSAVVDKGKVKLGGQSPVFRR